MTRNVRLTELEGVILGIVSSREPCSAYVVRQRFEASPTWGWSSSKGAIYPAVARLTAKGLLQATRNERGRRTSELLTVTPGGREALCAWLAGLSEEMGGASVDPIRTRINYLAMLDLEQRRAFLDQAEALTRAALAAVDRDPADPAARERWTLELTKAGVRMQIETKLRWLQLVRAAALPDVAEGLP